MLNPRAAVRRTARTEVIECFQNDVFLAGVRRIEHQAGGARIDDECHTVVLAELIDEQFHRRLHERQPIGCVHRTRHIDQENEVARRAFAVVDRLRFQRDANEAMLRLPGAIGHLDAHRKRVVPFWRGIAVREVIDHLFEPNRIGVRQRVVVQKVPHDRVTRGVDIDAKRRNGIHPLDARERIFHELAKAFTRLGVLFPFAALIEAFFTRRFSRFGGRLATKCAF